MKWLPIIVIISKLKYVRLSTVNHLIKIKYFKYKHSISESLSIFTTTTKMKINNTIFNLEYGCTELIVNNNRSSAKYCLKVFVNFSLRIHFTNYLYSNTIKNIYPGVQIVKYLCTDFEYTYPVMPNSAKNHMICVI